MHICTFMIILVLLYEKHGDTITDTAHTDTYPRATRPYTISQVARDSVSPVMAWAYNELLFVCTPDAGIWGGGWED